MWDFICFEYCALVQATIATETLGIGGKGDDIATLSGDAEAEVVVFATRETAQRNELFALVVSSYEGDGICIALIGAYPTKALGIEVYVPEGPVFLVKCVRFLEESVHLFVLGVLKNVPRQLLGEVPFAFLPELCTHEEELFARMCQHI